MTWYAELDREYDDMVTLRKVIKERDERIALLLELLGKYELHWWWCPVCESDYTFAKHKDDCPVKEELGK
jgi:hypothetical protein